MGGNCGWVDVVAMLNKVEKVAKCRKCLSVPRDGAADMGHWRLFRSQDSILDAWVSVVVVSNVLY